MKETSHEGFLCISVDGETWIIEEKHTSTKRSERKMLVKLVEIYKHPGES